MTPGARLRGATVARGDRVVLTAADLTVERGEVVAVVGPNGAGKSTLLHALAGDLPLRDGTAVLDGEDAHRLRPRTLARHRAVLTQHHDVAFGYPVHEVVAMGRAPWRAEGDPARDAAAVDEAIRLTDLATFLHRRTDELSGGERARVHLARVLAQTTPVLLLDEPTAALDLGHQELVLTVARRRAAAGTAVLVVLHDLGLAARHADRIVVVDGGRIRAAGRPDAVLTAPLLSEVYATPVQVLRHPTTGCPVPVPDPVPG